MGGGDWETFEITVDERGKLEYVYVCVCVWIYIDIDIDGHFVLHGLKNNVYCPFKIHEVNALHCRLETK